MKSIGKKLLVINDGVKIRPDWVDRIAVSYIPQSNNDSNVLGYGFFDEVLPVHGDFSGEELYGTLVGIFGRSWEVRELDGTLYNEEAFSEFTAQESGRYNFRAYTTIALNPSQIDFFRENDDRIHVGSWVAGQGFVPANGHMLQIELNPDYVWTNEEKGTVDFQYNVDYVGNNELISLDNNQSITTHVDSYITSVSSTKTLWNRNVSGNHVRFYDAVRGAYVLNNKDIYFDSLNINSINYSVNVDNDTIQITVPPAVGVMIQEWLDESKILFIQTNDGIRYFFTGDYVIDTTNPAETIIRTDNNVCDVPVVEGRWELFSQRGISFGDLTCDFFIPKSGYCNVQKVVSGGDYYVDLIYGQKNLMIKMGEVWNKPEWTNNHEGQDVAFREISEWIITG